MGRLPGGCARRPLGKLTGAAHALHRSVPTDEELKRADWEPDEIAEAYPDFLVWPENWPLFGLFRRLQTQWIVGMGGATGLNYPSAYPLLDRIFPAPADWDRALDDLQQMELAALAAMRGADPPSDSEPSDDDPDPDSD